MAPIKFEEDMKDKLEKRSIQPSEKSWATLSQRLDNEEKKSSKKGFWWLGIAASVVGILLVSNVFFNSETNENIEPIIVKENTIKDTIKIEAPKQVIETPNQEVIVKTEAITIKNNIKKATQKPLITTKYVASNTSAEKDTKPLVNKTQINIPLVIDNSVIQNETLAVNTENKTDKVENTEIKKLGTIDNEIDMLLAKATEEIVMQKTEIKKTPIDHNGLLVDVEEDLDETFRTKMFKVVKKGYETVKESVAERIDL